MPNLRELLPTRKPASQSSELQGSELKMMVDTALRAAHISADKENIAKFTKVYSRYFSRQYGLGIYAFEQWLKAHKQYLGVSAGDFSVKQLVDFAHKWDFRNGLD